MYDISNSLSKEELLDIEFLSNIFEQPDDVALSAEINALEDRARELKCLTQFKRIAAAFEKERKTLQRDKARSESGQSDRQETPPFIEQTKRGERVNPALLADYIRQQNKLLSVSGQRSNRIYIYQHGVYQALTDAALLGLIKQPVIEYDRRLLNMTDIRRAADDLLTDRDTVSEENLNADENLINFRNGLFSISKNKFLPHSEKVLSTIQLPFDYDAAATDCRRTVEYLFQLSGEDKEVFELLLQIAGVSISNIYGFRFKSAPILYGAGNSGKSQYVLLLQYLLGAENCASGSLSDLEQRFGTNALYLKRLYYDADMPFCSVDALRYFKCLTGGDTIPIEFKGKDSFSTVYRGLLIFCTNELPRFGGDRGEWVYDRIIPIPCGNSIPVHMQDKQLQDKLRAEGQAFVCSMLIPALQQVIRNNYRFAMPEKCKAARAAYEVDNSPVREFFQRFCDLSGEPVMARKFVDAFQTWYSTERGGRKSGISSKLINRELCQHLNISHDELKIKRKDSEYYCFGLTDEGLTYIPSG